MREFADIGVHSELINKLSTRYIKTPTEIQRLVIPKLLERQNVMFRSATGTGKTFAYLLPTLQLLGKEPNAKAMILAPTLELCSQIKEEVDFLLTALKSDVQTPYALLLPGSVKIDKQIEILKKMKPSVIIGNPGRLFALAKMGKLKLNNLRFLIMDEADRLTVQESMEDTNGLLSIIEKIVLKGATDKGDYLQVIGCSATVSEKTRPGLGSLFKDVQIIESDDHKILRGQIEHWAIFSEKRRKAQTLRSLLAALNGQRKKSKIKVLIFTSKNDDANLILQRLLHHKVSATGLFGKVNKKPLTGTERKTALDSFRKGDVQVLVSTDLAARGLDIPGITHVIALDVPENPEGYIHRCGRTGRAGKHGIMVTIGDETQMHLLSALEKKLKICIYPKELYGGNVVNC